MPKYRFRKIYFICEDKKVLKPELLSTTAYQQNDYADAILKQMDTSVKMWEINKPPIKRSVEGFYLVHESLFDELLKDYSK